MHKISGSIGDPEKPLLRLIPNGMGPKVGSLVLKVVPILAPPVVPILPLPVGMVQAMRKASLFPRYL